MKTETTTAGRPQKCIEPKKCSNCGMDFYRIRTRGRFEDLRDYENRKYCSSFCAENNNCMVHELVSIRIGEYYYSISNKLTLKKDEAKLYHPENVQAKITTLQLKHRDVFVRTEAIGIVS